MFSKTHLEGSGCSPIIGMITVALAGDMIDATMDLRSTGRTQASSNFISRGFPVIENKFVIGVYEVFLAVVKCVTIWYLYECFGVGGGGGVG